MKNERELENLINLSIEKQNYDFQEDIRRSLQFQTSLLDALRGKNTLNLRQFVRDNLNKDVYLYGVNILTLLSPDFTSNRDFTSCLTLILSFSLNTRYDLVFARLENIASFKRIQESNLYQLSLTSTKHFDTYYIQTESHVFYPSLNLIMQKADFEKMTSPIILNKISGKDLEKSTIFKRMLLDKNKKNACEPSYDYTFMNLAIDNLICPQNSKGIIFESKDEYLKQLDMLFYQKLATDRIALAQTTYALNEGQQIGDHLPTDKKEADNDFMCIYKAIIDNPDIF